MHTPLAPRFYVAQKIAKGCEALGVSVDVPALVETLDDAWFDRVREKAGGMLTVKEPVLLQAIQHEINMRTTGVKS